MFTEEIRKAYAFDEDGKCISPGKYHGEPATTIYYHAMMLAGDGESLYFNSKIPECDLLTATEDEVQEFNPPDGCQTYCLEYDREGNVYGLWLTPSHVLELKLIDEKKGG